MNEHLTSTYDTIRARIEAPSRLGLNGDLRRFCDAMRMAMRDSSDGNAIERDWTMREGGAAVILRYFVLTATDEALVHRYGLELLDGERILRSDEWMLIATEI